MHRQGPIRAPAPERTRTCPAQADAHGAGLAEQAPLLHYVVEPDGTKHPVPGARSLFLRGGCAPWMRFGAACCQRLTRGLPAFEWQRYATAA